MAYLNLAEKTRRVLTLKREPSVRSWIVCLGIFGCSIFAFTHLWGIDGNGKYFLLYCVGSLFLSLSSLDEWETCSFDKEKRTVSLTKRSIFAKLFKGTSHSVVLNTESICDVTVKSDIVKYMRMKVHSVCLLTKEGQEFTITDFGTSGDKGEHEAVRDMISSFLNDKDE